MPEVSRQLSVKFFTIVETSNLVFSTVGAIRESPLRLMTPSS
ncbi:hypothetical protein [Okeania sp. SIO3I5]|nr:hypothetical protein [Okeania sp. SIO3I5]